MRIVFMGPPGAGKGTQSQKLQAFLQVPHLSTGQILRDAYEEGDPLATKAAAYFTKGRLVPDELIVEMVAHRLEDEDCRKGCLLDGFPRTVNQAKQLDTLLDAKEEPLDCAVELRVDRDELLRRLAARGRGDDSNETIALRLSQYDDLTRPVANYYEQRGILHRIEAEGTQEEVFDRIQEAIEAAK